MADDNKRNALFSKLFGKGKKTNEEFETNENAELDKIMADDGAENAVEDNAETDNEYGSDSEYADWLTDEVVNQEVDPDEDITGALAELFGEDTSESEDDSNPIFAIPGFEDIAQVSEDGYEPYEAEEEPYGEEPEDTYGESSDEPYEDSHENAYEEENEPVGEYYEDNYQEYEPATENYVQESEEFTADELEYEDAELAEDAVEAEEEAHEEATQSSMDEDTATLLTALGYSDANAGGIKNTAPRRTESVRNRTTDLSLAYGYNGKEYMSHSQTSEIKSEYSRDKLGMFIRLGGTALFAILLLVYDVFGKSFGGVLDASVYPVVNILISLQILLIAAAFSTKQIFAGINGIFKGDPLVHSISAAAVVLTALYDIILAFVAPESFTLYNFPAAICLLLGAVHDYFVLEREINVFDRISSWQSVATLERVDSAELAVELGEGRVGDAGGTVGQAFRLKKGEFAENYFRHINRRNPSGKLLNCFIPVAFALSIVISLISLASDRSIIDSLNVFLAINLFSLPSAMFISMSYPFFTLVTKNIDPATVIFSESDVNEYRRVDTVVFEEADLFDDTSLTINRMTVCDKSRMQDVFDIMCGVSALYNKIGGRIAGAFRASTGGDDIPVDVKVTSVEDGGFEGMADGRYYCVGSDKYLASKGIAVTRYYDEKYIASNPGGVILHIAVDGAEVFKLYLTYSISGNMLSVIDELAAAKTRIVVRTIDPNINLDLITRILASTFDGKLTLVRKPYVEVDENASHNTESQIDGGVLVSGDSIESILDLVKACEIFGAFSKLGFYVNVALFALGVLISVLLGIVGVLAGISSLYIVLLQAVTVIVNLFIAYFLLKL